MVIVFVSTRDYAPQSLFSVIATHVPESHQQVFLLVTPSAKPDYEAFKLCPEYSRLAEERMVEEDYFKPLVTMLDEYHDGHLQDVVMVLSRFHNPPVIQQRVRPIYDGREGYTMGFEKLPDCLNSYRTFEMVKPAHRVHAQESDIGDLVM